MHEEVSETENIRKNLSIERQIVGGCEELLDVQQVFIRQGSLIQVQESNKKLKSFGGLGIKPHERKEYVRHCFLFSGLLLIATRSSNGKLHLHKATGKLHLSDVTLIETLYDEDNLDAISTNSKTEQHLGYEEMALRVVVHPRDGDTPLTITLVAQSAHEKAAWMSDLKQCIENVTLIDNVDSQLPLSVHHRFTSVRNDRSLYTDDVGIKYSKCLNSCRVPRIRYASLNRLFERLLDLRFLSIEFLNTFLITYRIFTDADTILSVLETFFQERKRSSSLPISNGDIHQLPIARRSFSLNEKRAPRRFFPDKIKNDSFDEKDKEDDEEPPVRPTTLQIPTSCYHRRHSSPSALGEGNMFHYPAKVNDPDNCNTTQTEPDKEDNTDSEIFFPSKSSCSRSRTNSSPPKQREMANHLRASSLLHSDSCQNGSQCDSEEAFRTTETDNQYESTTISEQSETQSGAILDASTDSVPVITMGSTSNDKANSKRLSSNNNYTKTPVSKENTSVPRQAGNSLHCGFSLGLERSTEVAIPEKRPNSCPKTVGNYKPDYIQSALKTHQENPSPKHSKARSSSLLERRKNGKDPKLGISSAEPKSKRKFSFPRPLSPRLGNSSPGKPVASPGAVVTSSRASKRRTSITAAAAAFAAATAGAACSPSSPHARFSFREVQGPLARVLTVFHHWVIKHRQDFQSAPILQSKLQIFLDKVKVSDKTTNEQRNFCNTILRALCNDHDSAGDEKLFKKIFLSPIPLDPETTFDKLSSNMLAEQMTLTEHLLFSRIPSHEFLNLSWMKSDKEIKAPNILRVSQRFNEVSRLVASEILCRNTASSRAAAIEKWVVVADVCRHLSNFNAVLEIISALMSSSIFRLKKTWEKLSKQTRALIDKLQALVSTDGRFKNMREALRCSNPPCIPYLGFYLTDLAFIEEGTSVTNENGLINFSKMRMIAQVVEEIRHYQEIRYNIQHDPKITNYLFCKDVLMDENSLYKTSLTWEPKKRPSVRLKRGDSQES